jgi:hypothetical protein
LLCPDSLDTDLGRDFDRIILRMKSGNCRFSEKVQGIKITMGWDYKLMSRKLHKRFAWLCLSLLVIWLSIVLWAEKFKDWSAAMGFGQVIAACISLVFLYTHD